QRFRDGDIREQADVVRTDSVDDHIGSALALLRAPQCRADTGDDNLLPRVSGVGGGLLLRRSVRLRLRRQGRCQSGDGRTPTDEFRDLQNCLPNTFSYTAAKTRRSI